MIKKDKETERQGDRDRDTLSDTMIEILRQRGRAAHAIVIFGSVVMHNYMTIDT